MGRSELLRAQALEGGNMNSKICEILGIEFPLVAFSHCKDVVAQVSKAGGMGVLGAVGMTPEILEQELNWIDDHVDGKPYGLDLLVPNKFVGKEDNMAPSELGKHIPQEHRDFRADVLKDHDIDGEDLRQQTDDYSNWGENMQESGATKMLQIGFDHGVRLYANALGVPPKWMLDLCKENNVPVAALVGKKEHAIRQVDAGVDILVVSGTEGGGHCGDVSTMVLVPEIARAIKNSRDVPILAAGGICTGEQMAGAMAMGASGAWCASVFLTTSEAETSEIVKEKMLAASSSQTVRSRSRTGKHSRQLQSNWTDAWESDKAPDPLPMPLQTMVSEPALSRIDKAADVGHEGAKKRATYWVGQGIGLVEEKITAGQTVQKFKEEFIEAYERLNSFME